MQPNLEVVILNSEDEISIQIPPCFLPKAKLFLAEYAECLRTLMQMSILLN